MAWYIDSSAALKILLTEAESPALRRWWPNDDPWSSNLLVTEMYRAAQRAAVPIGDVERLLRRISIGSFSSTTFFTAGRLAPAALRSLDAIHLAAALELGRDLEGVVTYDARLASASEANGVPVSSPGRPPNWWR